MSIEEKLDKLIAQNSEISKQLSLVQAVLLDMNRPINVGVGSAGGGAADCPMSGCEDQTIAGCDKGANRYALSVGLKYAFNLNTTFKLEYRRDGANLPVFYDVNSGSYRKNNDLFGASVVVAF